MRHRERSISVERERLGRRVVAGRRCGGDRRVAARLTAELLGRCERLVGELGFAGKRIAIERNGEIVPRSRYAEIDLRDGDRLEVVVAVGGG